MNTICRERSETTVQKEFLPLVDDAVTQIRKYFGKRFLAAYLHGSLNYGDAIPAISDMDCYIVIKDDLSDDDTVWIRHTENRLQNQYPIVDGVHLSTHSAEEVKKDACTRFILTYNSSLYDGIDIIKVFNTEEFGTIKPDKHAAKMRLKFARQCFADALNGRQPACTGELPENTYYTARKFARYFVIIEGAYWLMSINQFHSFQKERVLMDLRENCPEFNHILDLTEEVLSDPIEAGIPHEEFLINIRPFASMIFESISNI